MQTPLQGTLGATGEVAATLAEGKSFSEIGAGEVMAEFFGEMFTAPVDVAVATMATRNQIRLDKVQQSQERIEQIRETIKAASKSKVRQRSPETFAKFIDDAIQEAGADIEAVYIDPQILSDVLSQNGISPNSVPGVSEQLADATTTGTSVKIETGAFIAHLAETPAQSALIDHLKTSPDALTQSEIQHQARETAVNFENEVSEEVDRSDRQTAVLADIETVQTRVKEQLANANRFTPDVNNAYATMVAEFYGAMAGRAGQTPTQLYEQFPLKVVAESPIGDALAQNDRGLFQPSTNTIALLKGADLSTFLHEGGHFYFETLANIASRDGAPTDLKADLQTILDWNGIGDIATWQGLSLDERRDAHEKFARGFEAYLMEGKSPNPAMQSLFQRFKAWLVRIYRHTDNLNVDLTPEVRGVMDRLMASDEQIEAAKQVNGPEPLFGSATEADMTRDEWAEYQRITQQSTDEAIDELQRRSVRDMQWLGNAKSKILKALQREHKALRQDIEDEVRTELESAPVYSARRFLKTGHATFAGEPVVLDGGSHRLSILAVKTLYDGIDDAPAWTTLGYGSGGMLGNDGVQPDALADLVGFTSGDQMIRALVWA
ncbi:MAG: hypothetical protein WBC93_18060, partial [Sulfitobacter sp.]